MNRKRLGGGDGDGVVYGFDFYGFFNVGERKGKERKGKERKGKERKRKDIFGFVSRAKVFVAFGKSYHIRT